MLTSVTTFEFEQSKSSKVSKYSDHIDKETTLFTLLYKAMMCKSVFQTMFLCQNVCLFNNGAEINIFES